MVIFFQLAMVAQHTDVFRQGRVVGGDRSGFSKGPEILARVETEAAAEADRAGACPCNDQSLGQRPMARFGQSPVSVPCRPFARIDGLDNGLRLGVMAAWSC